jgi:hypothetical protein
MASEQEVITAIKTIRMLCKDEYAKAYATAALQHSMTGHELKVQCLYILNNLQYWRGDKARVVKQVLKEYSKR